MIDKIKRYLVAGSILKHIGSYIRNTPARIWSFLVRAQKRCDFIIGFLVRKIVFRRGKIQDNKIVVMTYDDTYGCNPRYIIDEVLRQNTPVDIVWVVPASGRIKRKNYPEGVRLVRRGSYTMFAELASAKVWIDNALNCVWYGMPKKRGQIYINTWHGSLGIKKLGGNKTWMHRAKRCNKLTDYCITNSSFEEDVFHSTFWPDVPYLRYGHARNDMFFDADRCAQAREKVSEFFETENTCRFFLYAPTFRDDGSFSYHDLDFFELKQTLEERFGGEWIILIRLHFKDRQRIKKMKCSEWLKNASTYSDMQELLSAVDAGMTDYSSWAYDYILRKRPLFIFAPDLQCYDQSRGFYYPLETTPFPIAHNNAELREAILGFDEEVYLQDVDRFLEEKGCYEDGLASKRAADKLREIMKIEEEPFTQVLSGQHAEIIENAAMSVDAGEN